MKSGMNRLSTTKSPMMLNGHGPISSSRNCRIAYQGGGYASSCIAFGYRSYTRPSAPTPPVPVPRSVKVVIASVFRKGMKLIAKTTRITPSVTRYCFRARFHAPTAATHSPNFLIANG